MAEVLPPHSRTEGQSYYASSGLRRSRPSQPSLYIPPQPTSSTSRTRKSDLRSQGSKGLSHKHRSLSSPSRLNTIADSHASSSSSPSSSSSTDNDETNFAADPAPDTIFYNYTTLPIKIDEEGNEAPPSSPQATYSTRAEFGLKLRSLHPRRQLSINAEDDTAVKQAPSRHVDYLSHDWREEDIWSSWRHIVSQRKVYGEKSRLENASWRTWAKQKDRLRTVNPQNLNW
jgi:hypothetical protein